MRRILNFINPIDEIHEKVFITAQSETGTYTYLKSDEPHISSDLLVLTLQELIKQKEHRAFDFIPFVIYGETELISRSFALGAADFIKSPFSLQELESRANRLIRSDLLIVGDNQINFSLTEMKNDDSRIPLSVSEYHILSMLIANTGRVVSRQSINYRLNLTDNSSRVLDVHINSLRNKISCLSSSPGSGKNVIRTVRGEGYTINPHTACG